MPERDPKMREREDDWPRWLRVWRNWVPVIAVLIGAAMAYWAIVGIEDKVDQVEVDAAVAKVKADNARQLAATQADGRRVSITIICGALRGVEDAGRLTLTDTLPGTEGLRQPRSKEQQEAGRIYAEAYNRVITQSIQAAVRDLSSPPPDVQGVIEKDGTVNCEALRQAAGTAPKP